jgi:thioredoxin reductase
MFGTTAISARKVLLATGVFDNLPSISGIEAYFGKTALPCSYCDGWEMRGKAISVYGRGARGFEMARAMTAWSSEVTLCTSGPPGLTASQFKMLEANGIAVRDEHSGHFRGRQYPKRRPAFDCGGG